MARRGFNVFVATAALALAVMCLLEMRAIQRLKGEIAQVETELSRGQEIWKRYPPLSPTQRRDLEEAQRRLFHMLPRDKEIPSLLEEIAGLARSHNLVDMSFMTGDGVAPSGSTPPGPAASAASQGSGAQSLSGAAATPGASKPIESIRIKVAFAGDYQGIALFLEGLKKLPRLVTAQSLKVQRGIPLLPTEVVLQAYYQKGELAATGK